ncbi:MAG: hypothetical protein LQ351_000104 [Letrouitia transgressa]|nr:MAG: hypothetical protein LQ351_000104 [Letrouitia transgressa]
MHSTLPLSALLLLYPLLAQSLQIPRSYANLAARQYDTYGTPYGNSDPWDDTDPDGTGSTTWLPDDYISGTGSSSSGSSSDTTGTSDTTPSDISLPTDEPIATDYIPTSVSLPTGTDELFFGAETTAAAAVETGDVFTTDLSGAATTADFFAGASSAGAATSAPPSATRGASASKPTTLSKASATKDGAAASSTGKSQPTVKVAGQQNAGEKTKAAGSMAALGVMVALAWIY